MTDNEIDSIQAGQELDQLIAEKIMGLEIVLPVHCRELLQPAVRQPGSKKHWLNCPKLPHYSTDIKATWEVVNLFRCGRHPQPNRDAVACVIEMVITDWVEREDCIEFLHSFCGQLLTNTNISSIMAL